MASTTVTGDLGLVTAYGAALAGGYTGSESDFYKSLAYLAQNGGIMYPVGGIYMSSEPTSPASLFGGTWERIKDVFLLAAGDTYAAGSTGGEASHVLSQAELPNIYGDIIMHSSQENKSSTLYQTSGVFAKSEMWPNGGWHKSLDPDANDAQSVRKIVFSVGENVPHNNIPPYYSVYIWQRIA